MSKWPPFLTDLHDFLVFKHLIEMRANSLDINCMISEHCLFECQQVFGILTRHIGTCINVIFFTGIFSTCSIQYEPNNLQPRYEKEECPVDIPFQHSTHGTEIATCFHNSLYGVLFRLYISWKAMWTPYVSMMHKCHTMHVDRLCYYVMSGRGL